jgi:hypothetical protein
MKKRSMQRKWYKKEPMPKYPEHKHKIGDTITIVSSVYSGVTVGEQGVVERLIKQGYGVAFTKTWPATVINEKPPFGKRILFFEHDEVK